MHEVTVRSSSNGAVIRISCRFPHAGHDTVVVIVGWNEISASQARHVNCMIGDMKPLILIALFAISAGAQSLPEVARQERERKANLNASHVLTTDTPKAPATDTPPPFA